MKKIIILLFAAFLGCTRPSDPDFSSAFGSIDQPVATTDLTVYTNTALASPFADWSWSATRTFNNTDAPLAPGSTNQIKAALTGTYGALSVAHAPANIPVGEYASVSFQVRGTSGNQVKLLLANLAGQGGAQNVMIPITSTWTTHNHTIASLKGTLTGFARISFQGTGALQTFYIDNVKLIAPVAAPVIASFAASPSTITSGSSSTLAWTITGNTNSVTLNGAPVASSGSQVVSPTTTTTYTLAASGAGGSAPSQNKTVTVDQEVYTNTALASPFADWSWSATRTFNNTDAPLAPGSTNQIKAALTGTYGALSVAHAPANIPVGEYASVSFQVRGTSGNQVKLLLANLAGQGGAQNVMIPITSTWTTHNHTIASLKGTLTGFARISFQGTGALQTFYVDNVRLNRGGFNYDSVARTYGTSTTRGSAGCTQPKPVRSGETVEVSTNNSVTTTWDSKYLPITIGSESRQAWVSIPRDYSNTLAYPIVFLNHASGGAGSTASASVRDRDFSDGKAIFVYLDAITRVFTDARGTKPAYWLDSFGPNTDFDLFLAAREQVRASYCIDRDRTFTGGFSQGGVFAHNLACKYGKAEISGFSVQAGSLNNNFWAPSTLPYVYTPWLFGGLTAFPSTKTEFACPTDSTSPTVVRPLLPPPGLMIHGALDTTNGAAVFYGRASAQRWAYVAGCTQDPVLLSQHAPTGYPCVGQACTAGSHMEYCEVPGLGHDTWTESAQRSWNFYVAAKP